jgi:hypothetical protein
MAGRDHQIEHARVGKDDEIISWKKKRSVTSDKRHVKTNYKTNLDTINDKATETSWRIILSIDRDEEEKIKGSSGELSQIYGHFWKLVSEEKAKKQLLNWNECPGDYDDLIYDEVDVNWYSLSIYYIYFNDNYIDNYSNNNDNNAMMM